MSLRLNLYYRGHLRAALSSSCSVLLIALITLLYTPGVFAQSGGLPIKLQQYVEGVSKDHSKWKIAISVLELGTGANIYALNDKELLIPASTLKLVTSYVALKRLGGAYKFPTEFFLDSLPSMVGGSSEPRVDFTEPARGVGNLYVRGYGDPTIESFRVNELAEVLSVLGIREVADLVLDDSLFVDAPRATGEKPHQAALGALSVGSNLYGVFVSPGSDGAQANVSLTPGAPFTLISRVRTADGVANNVSVKQIPSSSAVAAGALNANRELLGTKDKVEVVVEGIIGKKNRPAALFFTVPDPGVYFAGLLSNYLRLSGVTIKGVVRRGEVPESAKSAHIGYSYELSTVVALMNRSSSNFIAGQLLFALGQDKLGYFRYDLGLERIQEGLQELGFLPNQFILKDGSGLDRENRLTAEQLGKVLVAAEKDLSIGPDLVASLSRYGQNGTLRQRNLPQRDYLEILRGEEKREVLRRVAGVRAKTGTLEGVSSLAGYAEGINGERLAFVVLLNGEGVAKEDFARVEDGFVRVLVGMPAKFEPGKVVPQSSLARSTPTEGPLQSSDPNSDAKSGAVPREANEGKGTNLKIETNDGQSRSPQLETFDDPSSELER